MDTLTLAKKFVSILETMESDPCQGLNYGLHDIAISEAWNALKINVEVTNG